MKADEITTYSREAMWVTPDPSRTPHCKVCKAQGCMHFRRGFAHLLAQNPDCCIPTLATDKGAAEDGQAANFDILIPASCPCHGCNEPVVRADLNRGHDKSLSFNLDQKTGEWKADFVRYRYKRDTELVVGCAGRHKIIESPKAGRYAQLWCRTCCNCSISNKAIGNLVGCTNTAHWHTVTNRSYHEKTPFHQLAHNLLQASYNEALQARIPFEDAIGLTGQTYYKRAGDKGDDMGQLGHGTRRGDGKADLSGGLRNGKRERGGDLRDVHGEGFGYGLNGIQGINAMDAHMMRGVNGIIGNPQGHLQQLHGLQPGLWQGMGMDLHSGMMQQARPEHDSMVLQRQRTSGDMRYARGMQRVPGQMPMRPMGPNGMGGMMQSKAGGSGVMHGGINFGVDAYNAFRGMFDGGGGPMGAPMGSIGNISIGSGFSGTGLNHSSATGPMRVGLPGLPSINAEFGARVSQAPQGENGINETADPGASKAGEIDLENVPDILTNGGR